MRVNGKPGNLINIRDRGLLYGDGVFRTLRVSSGKAEHWHLHYKKIHDDCDALGIDCPDFAVLSVELNELLEFTDVGVVKLIVTRGEGLRGYSLPAHAKPTHIWDVTPLPTYPVEWSRHGIKARLCQIRLSQQPRLAGIKHLNRLENVLAAAEWNDDEVSEGVLLDYSGNIIEGTRSNLFMVVEGALITPDLSSCGVAGIQRERIMVWAAANNVPCRVAKFGLNDLLLAQAIFLVNSIFGLWPVRELEGRCWGAHPLVTRVQQYLSDGHSYSV